MGIGGLFVVAAQPLVGSGLWTLRKWAWTITVLLLGLRVVVDLVLIFSGGLARAAFVNLVIAAVLFWYLYRSNVKQLFVHSP